jgi:hypothetical protein
MSDMRKKLRALDQKRLVTQETTLWFGKWRSHRVDEVIAQDPGWLVWACDEGIIQLDNETYLSVQRAAESQNDLTNYRED